MQTESSVWQQAAELLKNKRLPESRIKFQELINMNGAFVARGYFGLGLVARELNDIDGATKAFEQALKIDPTMEGPARSLAQLAPRGVYGAYEFLREHPTPQAQDALVVMNQLRLISERRPSLTAYLSHFMPFLAASLVLFISFIVLIILLPYIHQLSLLLVSWWPASSMIASLIHLSVTQLVVFVFFFLIFLVCLRPIFNGLWRFLKVRTTRYTIIHGRLYVAVGIFHKKTVPYELFRVRFISLEKSFLNRLTRDGTLVIDLEIERGEPKIVKITGLARGEELTTVHRKLINLVGLLRNIPEVKGFIQ